MSSVVRMLRWYESSPGGRLAGEAMLVGVTLDELQALFDVHADKPMYDCWPVGAAQVARVSVLAGVTVDTGRYSYMVEADAADEGTHA